MESKLTVSPEGQEWADRTNAMLRQNEEELAMIESKISYADALTAALRRRSHQVDEMMFTYLPGSHEVDHVSTGRHTLVFELEGTKKTYRVTVEPIKETHQ